MRLTQVLAALALSALTATGAAAVTVKTGDAAPEFSLPGHDGKTHKLSDYKGKFVVLEWYNDGCPYVKKHYGAPQKTMQNLQKTYTAKDVVWFSVISSAPGTQGYQEKEAVAAHLKQHDSAPTAMLLDPEGTVGKAYGATVTPHMYIISPEGKLLYQGAIDDKPSANPESLNGAKRLFADALDLALAGKPITEHTTKAYGCTVKYKTGA